MPVALRCKVDGPLWSINRAFAYVPKASVCSFEHWKRFEISPKRRLFQGFKKIHRLETKHTAVHWEVQTPGSDLKMGLHEYVKGNPMSFTDPLGL